MTLVYLVSLSLSLWAEVHPKELLDQNQAFLLEMLKSPSPDIRVNGLEKLAELHDLMTLPAMSRLLEDSNSEVRNHAIRALAKVPYQESLDALKSRVGKDNDPYLESELRRSIKSLEEVFKSQAVKEEQTTRKKEKRKLSNPTKK